MELNFENLDLLILALPLPKNPKTKPCNPNVITKIFAKVTTDMEVARTHLLQISSKDTVALMMNLDDLWFDIDQHKRRGTEESILQVLKRALNWDMT